MPSSPALAAAPPPTAAPAAAAAVGLVVPVVVGLAVPTAVDIPAGPAPIALVQRRYETREGPTPPSPPHPWLFRRPLPPKRALISRPGKSSTSRAQEHPSSPTQGSGIPQDESLGSIIRRPILHCCNIPKYTLAVIGLV